MDLISPAPLRFVQLFPGSNRKTSARQSAWRRFSWTISWYRERSPFPTPTKQISSFAKCHTVHTHFQCFLQVLQNSFSFGYFLWIEKEGVFAKSINKFVVWWDISGSLWVLADFSALIWSTNAKNQSGANCLMTQVSGKLTVKNCINIHCITIEITPNKLYMTSTVATPQQYSFHNGFLIHWGISIALLMCHFKPNILGSIGVQKSNVFEYPFLSVLSSFKIAEISNFAMYRSWVWLIKDFQILLRWTDIFSKDCR